MHIGEVTRGKTRTFAIGHFALGYFAAKGSSKLLNTKLNLPLLLSLSVLPDIDLILDKFSPAFMHRGITHSIITFTILMIPFFIVYRKRALPYYAVLLSHSLIGDYFTGGIELLWPVTTRWFGLTNVDVTSFLPIGTEVILFAFALALMFKTGDLRTLLKPNLNNLWLVVAFVATLGPLLDLGLSWQGGLQLLIVIPNFFCLALFGYSMLKTLWRNGVTKPPESEQVAAST